jgi:hypothetical protein
MPPGTLASTAFAPIREVAVKKIVSDLGDLEVSSYF